MNSYGSVSRVSESIYKLLRYMNWIDTGDNDSNNNKNSNNNDKDGDKVNITDTGSSSSA
jgi:hypothetical protein